MASNVLAKGSASISINPKETEARLVFVPDEDGNGWDVAAIHKLAMDMHVSIQLDSKTISSFINKASRGKEQKDIVISTGIPPEEAEGEKVKWEALPVPGDMVAFQEQTLENAGAPKIFRIKTERVKSEKKIQKPGALPFMPSKEEISVSWIKKEIREEVNVYPVPVEVKYADKGTKLGIIIPANPGKPGKSIFGKPIYPDPLEDNACLFGEGINRDKSDLIALFSGFIRIGENWADIVPLAKHIYNINTGFDGITLYVNFYPGDTRFTPPTGEEIIAAAISKGAAPDNLISAAKLDSAIAESINHNEALESFSLFLPKEAEARVDITPDKTKAVLYLRKGIAGALPLEMKTISHVIKESLVHGFDTDALRNTIHAFMSGKELELKDYVLAEGVPSTRGEDREVEIMATLLPEDEHKPLIERLRERFSRNFSKEDIELNDITAFAFVEKDDVVARVSAGSEGEAGKDIFGNIIPGLPGNDPDIKLYKGLMLHGSDINASKSGLLIMDVKEKSFRGKVITYKNARIDIHFSIDAMEARASFYSEEGPGIPLSSDLVKKVFAEYEIKKGIDWERVEKACAEARTNGSALASVIARGETPVAKGGRSIKWLLSVDLPELSAVADGFADLNYEPGNESSGGETSVQIKAGTVIAELSDPVPEGRSGHDVQGHEIPAEKGTDLSILHDNSIREEKLANKTRLIAVRSGELVFNGKELKITSEKIIEGDLGPAAGKINFSGEIKVSGNVLSGSTIIGESHVTVNGVVGEALISAGGKAVIGQGLKGGGRGIIRARAGIEAAFSERGTMMAVGDIKLNKGSILSAIKTNGKLKITGENGKLSGGICQARNGIDVFDVGTEKGIRTEISFGQDYLIKDQIGICEEEIVKARRMNIETEEKIKSLLQKKMPLADGLKHEKIRLVKLLEQLNLRIFTLREKFEEHFSSEVRIRGTIYPGVVIESHDRYYEVKQKHSRIIFYFDRETGSIKDKSL